MTGVIFGTLTSTTRGVGPRGDSFASSARRACRRALSASCSSDVGNSSGREEGSSTNCANSTALAAALYSLSLTVANAALIGYSDRATFEAQGQIAEKYGFEEPWVVRICPVRY